MLLPVPLLVDLLEVDAVADDEAAAVEEEHVAEDAPEMVGRGPEDEQEEEEKEAPVVRARDLPRPGAHGLGEQRPAQQVLHQVNSQEQVQRK